MSVLVDENTRLCVAGITGREGTFHTLNNRNYGTNVVGGVTPGKGGQDVEGIPVFDSWADAVSEVQPNTAMIFVPPRFAADAILEAAAAGVELIIAITEGIPAHDELRAYNILKRDHPGTRLVGPNCPGHPLSGQGQRRHHPGLVLRAGQRRRRLALGHADLPDRQRDRARRLRLQLDRRDRRRPRTGLLLRRHPRPVRGRRARPSSSCSPARSAARPRKRPPSTSPSTSQSPSSPTSPASPPPPASRWATPGRSCPARPAPPPPRRRP